MSSRIYLSIDFGSTYTKLTAIDLDKEEIISTARAMTTVKTNVLTGFNMAFEELTKNLNNKLKDYEIVKKVACSSAAGGLKIIAIGLVPELTTEAAKKAALSSGGRVVKTYAFRLSPEDMEEISSLDYDILLLTGGTNGGNREYILDNARTLAENNIKKPIIIAGNEEVKEEVEKIFKSHNIEYYSSENVMPVVNKINVIPVKEVIREVFMKNIIKAKGMENVQKLVGDIIMPTPTAVMKAAEIFSKDDNNSVVIDIGGATTDVHSIGKGLPKTNDIQLKGMEEPYSKRTVEGDLGVFINKKNIVDIIKIEKLEKELNMSSEDIEKFTDSDIAIPQTEEHKRFIERLTKEAVIVSINRHAGGYRTYFGGKSDTLAFGKDLTAVKWIVGTGGALTRLTAREEILNSISQFNRADKLLPTAEAKILIDNDYIMASLGILSSLNKEAAIKLLLKSLKFNENTV